MATIVTTSGKSAPLTTTEMDANFTNLNTDKLEDSASDGSQYARRDGAWVQLGGNLVETSSTKPLSPNDGDVWFSESNGVSYVYNSTSGDWAAVGSPTTNGINTLAGASDVYLNDLGNGYILKYDAETTNPSYNKFRSASPVSGSSTYTPLALVDRSSTWGDGTTGYMGGNWISSYQTIWENDSDGTFTFQDGSSYLLRMRVELEETGGSGSGSLQVRLYRRYLASSLSYSVVPGTQIFAYAGQKRSGDCAILVPSAFTYFQVWAWKQGGAVGNIKVSLSAVKLAEDFT